MEDALFWKDGYSIGIEQIDMEHKIFLDLIRNLKNEIDDGIDDDRLLDLILEIEKYAEFHFISEENFMKKIKFPQFEYHRDLHYNLLEKLNVVKHRKVNPGDFLKFVIEWFITHTSKEDKALEIFCTNNNIKADFKFELLKNG
ncbi:MULTISPECIES: hemerythrin domain-containing protein [unclassified Saccharicrinis]|uniref:hemerythrin domain-containing protein n=1 Tax=unclassified Saccharicrinis TaxID=2646859 RepID=UPI003D340A85